MANEGENWKVKTPVKRRPQYEALMNEPRINTLARKLVIGVAPAGMFLDKDAFPKIPGNPREIIAAAKESFEAGATLIHVHCKGEDGITSVDPDLTVETLTEIKKQCPGVSISGNVAHAREHADSQLFEAPLKEIMKKSPEVFDTYTIQTATRAGFKVTKEGLRDQIRCLEDFGIKPEIQCPTLHGPGQLKEWVIDHGLIRMLPPFVNVHLGKVESIPIGLGEPLSTRLLLDALETLPKDAIRGVFACGRNWLPITTVALTQGIDFVRVGHDDIAYMYPHKDELAETSAEMVRKVVRIANELGIDVATAAEARKILGLRPMTSANAVAA